MENIKKNKYFALVKREMNDHKNGFFYVPGVIAVLIVVSSLIALMLGHEPINMNDIGFSEVADKYQSASDEDREGLSLGITAMYWASTLAIWMTYPFVVFFSLLGSLYEERRDKSILFWKSMPVSDAQEVIAKIFTTVIASFFCYLIIAVAVQLIMSLIMMTYSGFNGGPVFALLPLGKMIWSWFAVMPVVLLKVLWLAPILGWVLAVSAYAPRMPFMYAVVPVVVISILEKIMLESHHFAWMFTNHVGRGFGLSMQESAEAVRMNNNHMNVHIDGPAQLVEVVDAFSMTDAYSYALSQPTFWGGLIVCGVFIYGAIELRKRAS